ncbi:MAG TPA: hypothetical protein VK755_16065 [Candidatus Acidoferrales bacterium]|nr:hypothetical protein [Candidatus Acidoferrales bacterium]
MRPMLYVSVLAVAFVVIAFAVIFQLFYRYQFVANANGVWSVDRVTHATRQLVMTEPPKVQRVSACARVSHTQVSQPQVSRPQVSQQRSAPPTVLHPHNKSRSISTSTSTSTSLH